MTGITGGGQHADTARGWVYAALSNRLAELISGVGEVYVNRDDKRELLTLMMKDLRGTELPASSLSDGSLRFIALGVLELDPEATGMLCPEEPENGIHPERIPAMLQLLQNIALDVDFEPGPDNPLRQVVINTHSPAVMAQVPEDSVLFAETTPHQLGEREARSLRLRWLSGTWRAKAFPELRTIAPGDIRTAWAPAFAGATGEAIAG